VTASLEGAEKTAAGSVAHAAVERRRTGLSPVFVMNPYYSAIGIARSLHGHGVKVYALTSERDALGASSRYFEGTIAVPNGRDEPERLCEELCRIGRSQPDRPVLYPTRDFDVLFLHRYRAELDPFYVLPQGHQSPILRILDKFELAAVALGLGIPTPATWLCSSAQELDLGIAAMSFPVVVKPRFAYQWRGKAVWTKVGSQKAFIAESADQLRAHYQRVGDLVSEALVQEYVPGGDREIVVCCCYIGRDGDLAGYFTGRKLRQDPPGVGTGCVVEATDIPAIIAPSVKLLRAFGYRGMAEIEYKYDRGTGTYYLIEINPRHWDQHELGTLVGVNLTWMAYQDMVGMPGVKVAPVYEAGRAYKWVAEPELALGILRGARHELATLAKGHAPLRTRVRALAAVWQEVATLLSGRKIFAVMRLRDPMPGVILGIRSIREGLRRVAASSRASTPGEPGADQNIGRNSNHE